MRFHSFIAAAVLGASSFAAEAFTPEGGFYSPVNEPGTGIAVEIQNQFAFIAGYVYDPAGKPTFVTAQGTVVKTGNSWTLDSPLFVSENGRCIGAPASCPYKAPSTVPTTAATFEFLAENIMTVKWGPPNGRQELTFVRGEFSASVIESLLGEWDLVIDQQTAGNFFYVGDKLLFDEAFTISGRGRVITGCVPFAEGSAQCTNLKLDASAQSLQFGGQAVTVAVRAGGATANVVRKYRIPTYGLGGQFSQTFKGTMTTCTNQTSDVDACTGTAVKMVGYRSASKQYADTGVGMD